MNFDQWARQDDRAAEIGAIEAELEAAIEQRDQALAILWAIAERTSPDTVAAIESELALLRSLIEVGADEAAEILLKGDGEDCYTVESRTVTTKYDGNGLMIDRSVTMAECLPAW